MSLGRDGLGPKCPVTVLHAYSPMFKDPGFCKIWTHDLALGGCAIFFTRISRSHKPTTVSCTHTITLVWSILHVYSPVFKDPWIL